MKRVFIVGRPGAGKSTFAKKLAAKTGLPLIHLDTIYFDPKTRYYRNAKNWKTKMGELTQNDEWIIEGAQIVDFEAFNNRADMVIFLDYSRRVALLRLAKRHVATWGHVPEMPEGWREGFESRNGYWWHQVFWKFNLKNAEALAKLLAAKKGKAVEIFTSPHQAEHYLQQL